MKSSTAFNIPGHHADEDTHSAYLDALMTMMDLFFSNFLRSIVS